MATVHLFHRSDTNETDGHPEDDLKIFITGKVSDITDSLPVLRLKDDGTAAAIHPLYSVTVLQELIREVTEKMPEERKLLFSLRLTCFVSQ